jgi:predicted TIM-barrel fold metal-dependent hydrolase
MQSPGFRPGLREVIKRGLTFDAAVFYHQLPEIIDLADAFPDGTFVLNHCGHAVAMDKDEQGRAEVFRAWRTLLLELARREDAVGYLELATAWRPYVETTIEAFGASRCMMESNFPPDGRSGGFVPTWNALKHIVRAASPGEKHDLFYGTVARVYRLALPAPEHSKG